MIFQFLHTYFPVSIPSSFWIIFPLQFPFSPTKSVFFHFPRISIPVSVDGNNYVENHFCCCRCTKKVKSRATFPRESHIILFHPCRSPATFLPPPQELHNISFHPHSILADCHNPHPGQVSILKTKTIMLR